MDKQLREENSENVIFVSAGILRNNGKYLIAKRKRKKNETDDSTLEGLWEFPGGKIKEGELPQKALERELREELGLNLKAEKSIPLCKVKYPYPGANCCIYYYICEIKELDFPNLTEHSEYEWITKEQLLWRGNMVSADRIAVDNLMKYI